MLLLAGAPLNNATQFCDGEQCYVYRAAAATFGAARDVCEALGGQLVAYPGWEVQLRVERYFPKQLQLLSYWWVAAAKHVAALWAVAGDGL